ncbi:OmpP1/FadL family transporter [Dysgonomonas sp. 520]|uniref:OmpP1/FadL family transporter n=1 Tax=Dysgonomonas sp. 520 TaxID=2302931 RepID=UPI001627F38E|nr:aromatic hydrocarbon degradation protein [Dysgonomonas sp. 520]
MKIVKMAALAALILNASSAFAGGLLTNTNQSVHFLRNPARDASTEIDAVYTNPAGLIKLPEGFHFSFNNQSAFQTRTITSTADIFMLNGENKTKEFEGKASAPIIPSLQGVYRKGKWALSGSIAVTGGGGKATFDKGLPSFDALMGSTTVLLSPDKQTPSGYSLNQHMKGSNFIFGGQLGGTYEINKMFSAYAGFRLNIVSNKYEGYLKNFVAERLGSPAATNATYGGIMGTLEPQIQALKAIENPTAEQINQLAQLETAYRGAGFAYLASSETGVNLESTQSGWGVAPIIGFNFNYEDKLNVGIKYEFKTALDVENNTKVDQTGMFPDGVNTAHDIPALLTIGASYKITPKLTASVGYHHFFDSNAKMADNKQKDAGATNEYLAGLEYRIDKMFLVSAGGQITKYGVGNDYQRDLSFACDSYSIGLGGSVNVSPKVKINVAYFWTTYSDYDKVPGGGTNKDVFSRTNKVFGAGVDFSF